MEKESKNQKLKSLFTTHPKAKKFYFTSDEQAFFEKHHAEAHAATLDNKEVTPASRVVFEQTEKLKAQLSEKSGKSGKAPKVKVTETAPATDATKNPEQTGEQGQQTETGNAATEGENNSDTQSNA